MRRGNYRIKRVVPLDVGVSLMGKGKQNKNKVPEGSLLSIIFGIKHDLHLKN